ncbi:hypothetical protein [Halogeometricum luteum]|uniref:Uncharacterized protein n=1 Tax=Halogeometricum luteum TaxID=2950537 RepID=A0ABU2G6V7_9EURY|nr:hypothetical protein [Halogeometricum sp. S3BR5-2]MDS0296512.1 hypothetical protein [Halogeometricum sp. S3BR5-2]
MTDTDSENIEHLVGVYKQFFYGEISRAEAMNIINEEQWNRISRVAAFEISNERVQPVTDDELARKYRSNAESSEGYP